MALNAATWACCRRFGVAFLREARERTGEEPQLFDAAISHYGTVADSMRELSKAFPFFVSSHEREEHVHDADRIATGVEFLTRARDAEAKGL